MLLDFESIHLILKISQQIIYIGFFFFITNKLILAKTYIFLNALTLVLQLVTAFRK